jgi:hypothetical protein
MAHTLLTEYHIMQCQCTILYIQYHFYLAQTPSNRCVCMYAFYMSNKTLLEITHFNQCMCEAENTLKWTNKCTLVNH